MAAPVRIEYRQNADYFIESQTQIPVAGPLIPVKKQHWFFGVLIVAIVVSVCAQEAIKTRSLVIPTLAAIFMFLIMGFWFWFFKKIGLDRAETSSAYRLSEKDRPRLEKRLRKKIGQEDLMVAWQFDDFGLRAVPQKPGSAEYQWSAIRSALETPRGFLVYIGRYLHLWFPRAAFSSPDDYAAVRALLDQHVPGFDRFEQGAWAYVALGSNKGNSRRTIQYTIAKLAELSEQPMFVSSLWRTAPVDCPPDSPDFINAVAALRPPPSETPETLLQKLQNLQKQFGRKPKKVMNESRPLDLDLIAFRSETRATPELTLPHPRAHQRLFVLQPLSELAPQLVLPGQTKTVTELLSALPPGESVTKLER